MGHFFKGLLAKWHLVLLPALIKLGFWGAAAVALLDSSSIPFPMDAVIGVWVWNNKPHFWVYCLLAAVGSAIGGLVPYGIGRAGGELVLLKRVDRKRVEQLRDRFERQEFLAVMIPSMLPPPTPWKIFVFSAGVFEMGVLPYMAAVFTGRLIRWLVLSLLVLKLGPNAVQIVAHHAATALMLLCAFALIGFTTWWWKRKRKAALQP